MSQNIIEQAEEKMEKAIGAFKKDLSTLRAGRANPAILDRVQVEYYGTMMPINQLANINVPEPRLIVIQPWDKSSIGPIEKAIQKAELGLSPTNDGNVIRLPIPPLTEERRTELVKMLKKMAEESRVAIRNIRRDANDEMKKIEKEGTISEDESRREQEKIQKLTDKYINIVDELMAQKEKDIMEV
ncbi:ribosome recycling factor [Microaerobacter geothermalis]|uniref:ribosome recycling factor n=1 Tax=Microaerobacter geothermalis TaxID=674972 RepID=UPI001F000D3C|nr:ribosome recycling factor [Microaerobacter geothermalis]MCF6093804.1 ribosome recycling factor [Microaerobacter geothermalis]